MHNLDIKDNGGLSSPLILIMVVKEVCVKEKRWMTPAGYLSTWFVYINGKQIFKEFFSKEHAENYAHAINTIEVAANAS